MQFDFFLNVKLLVLTKSTSKSYGPKVDPFVKPITILDVTKENRLLSKLSRY